nr:hypothetical protein [Tanacetum cinerariifolium]
MVTRWRWCGVVVELVAVVTWRRRLDAWCNVVEEMAVVVGWWSQR